jgi:hypothetical protein
MDSNTSKEAFEECYRMIGSRVRKRSNKPFKSTTKVNRVKSIVIHEQSGLFGFKFEDDDSVVECWRCVPVDCE